MTMENVGLLLLGMIAGAMLAFFVNMLQQSLGSGGSLRGLDGSHISTRTNTLTGTRSNGRKPSEVRRG